MINAVLRSYLRDQKNWMKKPLATTRAKYGHPKSWILKMLQESYPEQWEQLIEANNSTKAPMWLRVNRQHHTRDEYVRELLKNENIEYTLHSSSRCNRQKLHLVM
ncbi:hypothetical protein OH492_01245 [Vibrio chagasii]|nr:hypothetical protein [Vibrio chagasii]